MSGFKLNVFSGVRPRVPESLLKEGDATVAEHCDFAYGELRNTKNAFTLNTLGNVPASIYTDDGLTFYSWTREVSAVRAPMVADTFNRLYYTDNGEVRVTDRTRTALNGGEPPSSYKVGVPRPSKAPALSVPSLVSLDTVDLAWTFHYESGGVKYQEQTISAQVVTKNTAWKCTAPALGTGESKTPSVFQATSLQRKYLRSESGGQYYTTEDIHLPSGTEITILSAGSVSYSNSSGSDVVVRDVILFFDENKQPHELESAFTLQKYGFVKESGSKISSKTPLGAVAVFRLTGTDKTTKANVFNIYTNASSFCDTSSLWRLSSASSGTDSLDYTLTLEQGVLEQDKETRAYVYCYVNTYNEMGPPSAPAIVTTTATLAVDVGVTRDADAGYAPIKEIRVFRTPTGSTAADYFYAGSITVLTKKGTDFSFHDDKKGAELNEEIESEYYYPPPSGLKGLIELPNGILCAVKDNELWFSEAYKPWAWPPAYTKVLGARVVGAIAHGSGAFITTAKEPYLVSGIRPESMIASRVNADQAGVSSGSMAIVDGAIVYASHDGIVTISGATASLSQGQKFFTREIWRARYGDGLSSMQFAVWDGRLVVYSSKGAFVPFMIRFDEADGQMTDLPSLKAQCHFVSKLSDQLYLAAGNALSQFNGGTEASAVWMSGENVPPKPLNYGAAQVVAEGDWTVELWAHNGVRHVLRHSQQITTGSTTFRLPGGYLSDRYKIRISGAGRFRELRVAETGVGLAAL